uniref:Uncharacterized protein n=1 Tax=Avena sativa TaxID=4498 RepID=A0ACD6ABS5_AVESA
MRLLRSVANVGVESLTGKSSLVPMRNLWNEWEIHFLILTSLALQFLLFFAGGMRKRSTWPALSTILWLAYLSADSVAVFILGHLAVRGASGPEHELLLFWAPFLLVHLGGQDTITALSVQDNELWTRHLLGLVSQVAVAGYVVSKSSWQDKRMLAATVIVFLSGSFKYAGRTYCLYSARPANVRFQALRRLSNGLKWNRAWNLSQYRRTDERLERTVGARFDLMVGKKVKRLDDRDRVDEEIMSADAPINELAILYVLFNLPSMLVSFDNSSLHWPYEYVGQKLLNSYERFYTKAPFLYFYVRTVFSICQSFPICNGFPYNLCGIFIFLKIPTMFLYLSIPIALVLFILAEKEHQVHNRVDVVVTYILLIGAIILDVFSVSMSILSSARRSSRYRGQHRIQKAILRVANYIQPTWSKKKWSEKLVQYSMVKKHSQEDTTCMSSPWHWIIERLTACGVEQLDPNLTHTPVTEDLKGFVLNNLIQFGKNKEYNIANFWGLLALQKWKPMGLGTMALYHSINGVKDAPRSILIWHIATDICYYCENSDMANTDSERLMVKKQMSRELSNYILYLVFKCGVMLTSNTQLLYNEVHDEINGILKDQLPQMANLGEKEVVKKVFEGTKAKQQPCTVNEEQEQSIDTGNTTAVHVKKLLDDTEDSIYSPVLPRASNVAQELMGIEEKEERWNLIAAVWLEMLYCTAPRCGGAFHYDHLAKGGEFITHVLVLMRSLGPFLPGHNNTAP